MDKFKLIRQVTGVDADAPRSKAWWGYQLFILLFVVAYVVALLYWK